MSADNSNIHRLLDEAFAEVTVKPELQDLKEELRGNLSARVDELVEHGTDPATAATIAMNELGDIRQLIDEINEGRSASSRSRATANVEAYLVNRVRPKPAFVIRTVLLSAVVLASAMVIALGTLQLLAWPNVVLVLIAILGLALPGGVIVTDTLRQETSIHYPLPATRSRFYGACTAASLLGLAFLALYLAERPQLGFLIAGIVLVAAAIIGFIWLGTTQTNRTKPWVRTAALQNHLADRFSQDPAAAARFGIYTVIIWIVTFAAFIVLSITTGFTWSWLVLLAGFAGFMFMLARMQFPAGSKDRGRDRMES